MCDHQYNAFPRNNFFQQYMYEHARMNQFFQNFINVDTSYINCRTYCCSSQNPVNVHCPSESCSCSSSSCCSSSSFESSSSSEGCVPPEHEEEEEEYNEEPSEDDGEDDEECEYELNVDAILAMRAAKEALKQSSSESDSIVLIDSDKEEFEFVELGSLNTLESKLSRNVGSSRNRNEELQTHKKIMEYLYGEKSTAISGLETTIGVNFEHLCEENEPSLWPVLPLRLN